MRIVALLDACVLYPAPVRDFLLNLAEADIYKPKWTRNLLANLSDLEPERIQRTAELMDGGFPDALKEGYDSQIPDLELPDPDDRHVLAAAISAGLVDWLIKKCG